MPLMHSTVSIRQVCKCIDRFIDSLRLEVTSLTEHFGCQIKISTISALELLIIRQSFRRFYYQFRIYCTTSSNVFLLQNQYKITLKKDVYTGAEMSFRLN